MKRKLMSMAFKKDPLLDEVSLSTSQHNVLMHASFNLETGVTASELSKETELTMRRCSAMLKVLYDKGFLIRRADPNSTNGIIYRYTLAPDLWPT